MRFCELCRKPEDLNHLFLNCPLYESPRRRLVQNVGVMGIKVLDLPGVLRLMNQKHPQLCKGGTYIPEGVGNPFKFLYTQ